VRKSGLEATKGTFRDVVQTLNDVSDSLESIISSRMDSTRAHAIEQSAVITQIFIGFKLENVGDSFTLPLGMIDCTSSGQPWRKYVWSGLSKWKFGMETYQGRFPQSQRGLSIKIIAVMLVDYIWICKWLELTSPLQNVTATPCAHHWAALMLTCSEKNELLDRRRKLESKNWLPTKIAYLWLWTLDDDTQCGLFKTETFRIWIHK